MLRQAAFVMVAVSLLAFLNIVLHEFGPWRHEAIQVDELFFATCAARGLAVGEIPVAGCHDNKGPFILFFHQLVQMASSRYDLVGIKAAAFAVVGVIIGLVGLIAHRLGGWLAATMASVLVLQSFSVDASFLALKTETLGVVFTLTGLAILGKSGTRRAARFLAGVAIGMAVVTKQTNLLVALAVMLWLCAMPFGKSEAGPKRALRNMAAFGLGLLLPGAATLLVFVASGREAEFLASFVIYPSVYGGSSAAPAYKMLVWKLADVLTVLATTPLLALLFAVSLVPGFGSGQWKPDAHKPAVARHDFQRMLILASLALLLSVLVAPIFFPYHLVPVRILMAILGGVVISGLAAELPRASPKVVAALCTALITSTVLAAASSWYGNAGKSSWPRTIPPEWLVEGGRGQFGYVLGMWPEFYVVNDLIPASSVMFPWALAGTPGNHFYSLPPATSLRGRLLGWSRERGLRSLQADFVHTPPRFIALVESMSRAANSPHQSDVPGMDEYLSAHCGFLRHVTFNQRDGASIYRCRPEPETASGH